MRLTITKSRQWASSQGHLARMTNPNWHSWAGRTPRREIRTKAKSAYEDFLALWKNADPDIPILKQAKAEYAKLQ